MIPLIYPCSNRIGKSDTGVNDASAMDDESDDGTRAPSPSRKGQKVIGGRVHKARVPPRNTGKKTEHKKLDDPVVAMDNADDEEGNNVASGPESEDRLTLRESEGEKKEAVIKGEEAV